jgi:hypothetical protein
VKERLFAVVFWVVVAAALLWLSLREEGRPNKH